MSNDGFIVSLLGICVGFAFFTVFLVSIYTGWVALAEVFGPFAELWRRFLRRPQFGMRNLFSLTVIISLTCAMLRWLDISDFHGVATFGIVLLVWAIGIVLGVEFAVGDLVSQYGPSRKSRDDRPLELWDEPLEPQRPHGDGAR